MELNQKDIQQIQDHGLTPDQVSRQVELLNGGVQPTLLVRPAVPGDGIVVLSDQEKRELAAGYRELVKDLDVVKFVPASGAATRMFKDLYAFAETGEMKSTVREFVDRISEFAFYEDIVAEMGYTAKPEDMIRFLLFEKGFAGMPKGLLPFHKEGTTTISPLVSHIVEATDYSDLKDGTVALHFTLSPEHIHLAEQLIWETVFELEDKFGIESSIHLSEQDPSTDTIALTKDNDFFRDDNGGLVFRPGGHGSLLSNLQSTEADLIFIRNIDNVLPPKKRSENVFYKQVLGGYLVRLVRQIHKQITLLERNAPNAIKDAIDFIRLNFGIQFSPETTIERLIQFLNRPVRVAGMVKNEGEPGGGPFWVKKQDGSISLQIVESVQVANEEKQQSILKSATHFNPVDMVCYIRNHKGDTFNLMDFVDSSASLVVEKTIGDKQIRGLEHPGLWNGSMADWLTIFIEVPVSTFNPVKTINDLLKPAHRG